MSILELERTTASRSSHTTASEIDVVIPVYNEAAGLADSVKRLRAYLDESFPYLTTITIVDNASTDGTWKVATELARTLPRTDAIHLDRKGRGRALRHAWLSSDAPVVAYMDVDLSTGLDALLPLVAPLLSGHSDLAIGTRLAPGAHVVRGAKRELISRCYNLILRTALGGRFTDAQCGFKAIRSDAVDALVPLVEDNEWFFDTEILVLAQRNGFRIAEVPVDWTDDPDSRVDVVHTALQDLRGVRRMLRRSSRRTTVAAPARATRSDAFADELLRFAGVGLVSTLVYLALFVALRPALGALAANLVAITAVSLGNTTAHRRLAGLAGHPRGVAGQVTVAALLWAVSAGATTAALLVAGSVGATSLVPQVAAVLVAGIGAAAIRFSLLRSRVFRSPVLEPRVAAVAPVGPPRFPPRR